MSPLRSSRARFLIAVSTVACAVTFATASAGAQARRDSAASAQLPPGMPMDTAQARRWAELFTHQLTEIERSGEQVLRRCGFHKTGSIRFIVYRWIEPRWAPHRRSMEGVMARLAFPIIFNDSDPLIAIPSFGWN